VVDVDEERVKKVVEDSLRDALLMLEEPSVRDAVCDWNVYKRFRHFKNPGSRMKCCLMTVGMAREGVGNKWVKNYAKRVADFLEPLDPVVPVLEEGGNTGEVMSVVKDAEEDITRALNDAAPYGTTFHVATTRGGIRGITICVDEDKIDELRDEFLF